MPADGGLYLMFLLALSAVRIAGVARGLWVWLGERPAPAEPIEAPWWVGVIAVVVGLLLTVLGVVGIKVAFELMEFLASAWRRGVIGLGSAFGE